jgi:WD40 repeat protein
LLAHALQATWQERHGSTLTVEGYRAAGGIEHAIADSAEQVFARLDSTAQEEARGMFLRLVKIGNTSGEDVRRPVPRSDLLRGSSIAETVIDAYTARRLLTQSRDAVQISHESLLGAWPRLTAWIDDDRAGQLARQRIEDDAADWDRTRRDPSLLYRGARLETAAEWASRHSTKITDTAGQFLDASRRLARRTRLLRQSGVTILAVLALATTVISVVALQQRSTAIAQRNLAIYNQVVAWASQLAGTNRSTAAQLLLTAYRMPQGPGLATRLIETENEPLSAFVSADGPVTALAASPHGHLLASSSYYGKVSLWDVTSATHPRSLEQGLAVGAGSTLWLAFSPDGDTLATGNNDGTVRLWDITDPARPRELGNALDVGSIAQFALQFSPDGRVLATSYDSSAVRLWDVATPARPRALGQPLTSSNEDVISLAFSPDGHTLATGNLNGAVSLWDVAAPARPRALGQPLSSSNAIVFSLAFSPDGRTLATGDSDSTIGLWDVTDPAHPSELSQPLTVGTSNIFAVSYGPDARTLYSGNSDGTIGLTTFPSIDLGTGAQVESLASSPRKRILATGNTNGTIDLWDVTQPAHPSELSQLPNAGSGGVGDIAFSPDGSTLAGASDDGTVELWDVRDPSHPSELSQPSVTFQGSPSLLAFSSDGLTLATHNAAGTVALWDIADPASPRKTGQTPAIGSNDSVYFAAFSPGRRILATGYQYAGAIDLWDVSDPAHPRELSQPLTAGGSDVTAMAFSPDGRILAGSDGDGTVTLWDIADPDHPRELSRPETAGSNTPASLVFSPDGRTLASGSFSGTITLWNITNADHPRALGQPLAVTGAVGSNSLAFSPDSQVLADGNNKGPTLLWDLDPSYAMSRICATTNLTRQDWDKYVSGLPYGPPADTDNRVITASRACAGRPAAQDHGKQDGRHEGQRGDRGKPPERRVERGNGGMPAASDRSTSTTSTAVPMEPPARCTALS